MQEKREGETLYLEHLTLHIQMLTNSEEGTSVGNKRGDHQISVQLSYMKDTLHCLDTITIHLPDFDCDIAGGSDGPTTNDQEVLQYLQLHCQLTMPPLLSDGLKNKHIPPIQL